MQTITFYSFKGGVGRSLALVNVGVELARRGRRVLLVDFDLEAPSLDTFDALGLEAPNLGIVDFVHSYLERGVTDNAGPYLYPCVMPTLDGKLWLMPAGGARHDFASFYQHIDWGDLYDNQDGFLLMEDLKQQWQDKINPDYVLIDCRSGLTDVCGICTRQLADVVAVCFAPNKQHLRGVSRVVREIRTELHSAMKKEVQLHFIVSNIPDVKDEQQSTERAMQAFKAELELVDEPLMVHHHDSLSLIHQEVFVQSHPRSRLAGEYREIVDRLVDANMGDREGALHFLEDVGQRSRARPLYAGVISKQFRLRLEEIERSHAIDSEIMYRMGLFYHQERDLDRALTLYHKALDLATENATEIFLDRAQVYCDLGKIDQANEDAFRVLESSDMTPQTIRRVLSFVKIEELQEVCQTNAVITLNLEDRARLGTLIAFENKEKRQLARELLSDKIDAKEIMDYRLRNEIGIVYLSLGEYSKARDWFSRLLQFDEDDIPSAFNFATASWGATGQHNEDLFKKVTERHEIVPERTLEFQEANYFQCIALSYWATGEKSKTMEMIAQSELALKKYRRTLSSWSYRYVYGEELARDLQEMKQLFEGDSSVKPPFLANAQSG